MIYRKRKLHRLTFRKKVFILLSVFFILLIALDHHIRPFVKSVASNRAKIVSATLINEAVLEELNKIDINYSDIIFIDKDQNGKIISVNTNMRKINSLKSAITLTVQQRLLSVRKKDFAIPIGTLTKTAFLNGRGPKIPLKVSLNGSVVTTFRSNFESGGINQTKHQLYLDISTKVCAFVPGYPVDTDINTSVLVAETVLLGDVPSFFSGSK